MVERIGLDNDVIIPVEMQFEHFWISALDNNYIDRNDPNIDHLKDIAMKFYMNGYNLALKDLNLELRDMVSGEQ